MKHPALEWLLRSPRPLAFSVRLVLLIALFVALSLTDLFKRFAEEPLIGLNAWLTHLLLNLLGLGTRLSGRFVNSNAFHMEVVAGCTGLFVFLMLSGAVLAFPCRWSSRLKALLLGAALVFILNQARLASLFLVGVRFPDLFHDLHLFVWQGLIIIIVGFYWYAWASRCSPDRAAPEA